MSLLREVGGIPVGRLQSGGRTWASEDRRLLRGLERLAHTVGVELVDREASPAQLLSSAAWGLGSESYSIARRYAHLTGRRFEVLTPQGYGALAAGDVVIATQEHLSFELLETIYELSVAGVPVGIVCGSDVDALGLRSLVSSALLALSPLPYGREVALIGTGGYRKRKNVEVLGCDSDALHTRTALVRPSTILLLAAHSDGIDIKFPGGLLGCPVPNLHPHQASQLHCVRTGYCHRAKIPRIELNGARVVLPDQINAAIALWCVCYGVVPTDAMICNDATWLPSMLSNAGVGLVITGWGVQWYSFDELIKLVRLLREGRAVGDALAEWLRRPWQLDRGVRKCVFGDPLVSIDVGESGSNAV